MTKYCIVKKSDMTNEVLNRSLSNNLANLPVYISTTKWLWLFPISTEFYIVEFDPDEIKYVTYFDSYQWYSREEMRQLILENSEEL